MHAHELRTEFLFELGQWLFDQVLAFSRTNGDVFQFRTQKYDRRNRYQLNLPSLCNR